MSTIVFKTIINGRQAIVKIFIFTIIAFVSLATIAFFASCGTRRNAPPIEAITDEGVVINGVRWATRNADGFRTFVSLPEMAGGFYRWRFDRARDRHTLTRSADSRRDRWSPCPPGWRLPTNEEFESLIAAGSVWTTVNGVYGRLFGAEPNQLFLPAAGKFVDCYPNEASYENELGFYWVEIGEIPARVRRMSERTEWIEVEPRMLKFCQDGIDIRSVRGVLCQDLRLTPILQRDANIRSSIFTDARWITPELSIRCVAVTADDEN